MERALTISQAAAILSVSETTVYRLAAAGKVPAVKVGTAWRFTEAMLAKFLAGEWQPKAPKRRRGGQLKDYGYLEELNRRGPALH